MRFAVIVRPKFPIPPEQTGMVLEGFAQWREKYRGGLEVFEFFAGGGGGGFGIADFSDVESLNQMRSRTRSTSSRTSRCTPRSTATSRSSSGARRPR